MGERVPAAPEPPDDQAGSATTGGQVTPQQFFFVGAAFFLLGAVGAFVVPNPVGLQNMVLRLTIGVGLAGLAAPLPGKFGIKHPLLKASGPVGLIFVPYLVNPAEFKASAETVARGLQAGAEQQADEIASAVTTPVAGDTTRVALDTTALEDFDSATATFFRGVADSLGVPGADGGVTLPAADFTQALRTRQVSLLEEPRVEAQDVVQRARSNRALTKSRLLWIDDRPEGNASLVGVFESMGIEVVQVQNDAEARRALDGERYDVVVSDIGRQDGPRAGIDFLESLPATRPPFIFYVGVVRKSYGVPAGAVGITNRPDELVSFVLDALER